MASAGAGPDHLEVMAPRREVVEREPRRTGPCQAVIEHIPKPRPSTAPSTAERDTHSERGGGVRVLPR